MSTVKEYSAGRKTAIFIACTLIMFLLQGSASLVAVLVAPMMTDFSMPLSAVALIGGIGLGASLVCSAIGSKLIDIITPKWAVMIACILGPGHLFLYAVATQPWILYLSAVMSGIGLAFGQHAAIAGILAPVFKEKTQGMLGTCFAIGLFGGGFIQMIMAIMWNYMTWQKATVILGTIYLILCVALNLIFIPTIKVDRTKKLSKDESRAATAHLPGLTLKQAQRTAPLFLIMIVAFILQAGSQPISSLTSPNLIAQGLDKTYVAMWVSVASYISAALTFVLGFVARRFGPKVYGLISMGGIAIAYALFALMPMMGYTKTTVAIAFIFGGFYKISSATVTIFSPSLFGQKETSSINSFLFIGTYAAGFLASIVWPKIIAAAGYTTMYWTECILIIVGIVLMLIACKQNPYEKWKKEHASEIESA